MSNNVQEVLLTDSAKQHLINLCAQHHEHFIKLSVNSRGCSGNSFQFEFCDIPNKLDIQIHLSTESILVLNHQSLMFLLGTEVDWVEDQFGAHFTFSNSKITASCGCGESYHFK